jgi:hypothetical protein
VWGIRCDREDAGGLVDRRRRLSGSRSRGEQLGDRIGLLQIRRLLRRIVILSR